MATYITLAKWTREGAEKIKDSPARLDAFKKLVQAAGGTVKGFYMVAGRYDMVLILEAPDAEAMAKISLATAARGSVSTETLLAFPEEEYRKIIAGLPG
jgi:uncharacterized protein with GYD domain